MSAHRSERRLHPIAFLLELGGQVREFAFTFVAAFLASRGAGVGAELAGAIAAVPIVALSLSKLLTFRYRHEAGEVVVRWGLLFRRERHIPVARIQNLDARESLLHRLTGTVAVAIETGTGGEVEATMAAIPRADFAELQHQVRAARRGLGVRPVDDEASASDDLPAADGAEESGRVLVRLGPRDLVVAGLLHGHGWVLVGAAVALWFEVGAGGPFLAEWLATRLTGAIETPWSWSLSGDLVEIAVALGEVMAVLVLAALALRVLSVLVVLVRHWDHTVTLVDRDLRTSMGLLTRMATSTPLPRIQTVVVRSGPLHRRTGHVRVQVTTAGGAVTENPVARAVLAPILPAAEVPGLLATLLPGAVIPETAWARAHPRAPGRAIRRTLLAWSPLLALAAWFGPGVLFPAVLATVWSLVVAWMAVRRFRYHAAEDLLVVEHGWLWRQRVHVRPDRMQAILLEASPFDRRAGMARLLIDTAGFGSGGARLPHLGRREALRLVARYYPAAATTAFRT